MAYCVEDEIATQPDRWARAATLLPQVADLMPQPGGRVAFVGCGTSWFVGQVPARWRETADHAESDAFTASEMPDRRYDRGVALTRSGTGTEVVELLRHLRGRIPTVAVTADVTTPIVDVTDQIIDLSFADEQSVVQTRFATTTLALFRAAHVPTLDTLVAEARQAVIQPLEPELVNAEEMTFLGTGWTIGLIHGAARKFRETSSGWAESYPAMDYRHGPIAIAGSSRVDVRCGAEWAGGAGRVHRYPIRPEHARPDGRSDRGPTGGRRPRYRSRRPTGRTAAPDPVRRAVRLS